jgi:hypothetical protein
MQVETILNSTWAVAVIVIVCCVITYVIKKGKVGLYDAALYLVTVAEDEWGSDTGKIKFAQVLTTIKKMYPITTFFLKQEDISQIIEDALDEMKRIIASKKAKEEKLLKEELEKVEQESQE